MLRVDPSLPEENGDHYLLTCKKPKGINIEATRGYTPRTPISTPRPVQIPKPVLEVKTSLAESKQKYSDEDLIRLIDKLKSDFGKFTEAHSKESDSSAEENYRNYRIMSEKFAVIWLEKFGPHSHDKRITKQDFVETIYTWMVERGYLSVYHYLQGLEKHHLERLFDIYTWTQDAKLENGCAEFQMNLITCMHAFLVCYREYNGEGKEEETLANTINRIFRQHQFLQTRLKLLSRKEVVTALTQQSSAQKYILTLDGGRLEIIKESEKSLRVTYGLVIVFNLYDQDTNTYIHHPLYSADAYAEISKILNSKLSEYASDNVYLAKKTAFTRVSHAGSSVTLFPGEEKKPEKISFFSFDRNLPLHKYRKP